MKRYIIDTSYISNMAQYYEISDSRFSFIWDSLFEKIKTGKIIVPSKVLKELKKYSQQNSDYLKEFLNKLTNIESKEENPIYVQKVIKTYETNKTNFRGSFDRFAVESSADLSIIAIALEFKETGDDCLILTDEILASIRDKSNKIKLNIPSLAKLLGIDCIKSEKGVFILLD